MLRRLLHGLQHADVRGVAGIDQDGNALSFAFSLAFRLLARIARLAAVLPATKR